MFAIVLATCKPW